MHMTKRPGKIIPASTIDLFNLQPTLKESIYEIIKKDKRTTQSIIVQKLKCSHFGARSNLEHLIDEGKIKDIGTHFISGKRMRVYEIV